MHMHDQLMLQFYLADLMGVRTWGELAGVECKGREREREREREHVGATCPVTINRGLLEALWFSGSMWTQVAIRMKDL